MNLRSLVPPKDRSAPARLDNFFFGPIDRLLEQISQGATNDVGNIVPRIDVVETDKSIELTAELPGLEEDDVEISLVDNVLTIHGEKQAEQKREDENYHVTERVYGSFYRAIELPAGIDPSRIEASMANGVLRITIPKPARNETQKVAIKKGDDAKSRKEDTKAA
jgi:HSP20 family protein